METYLSLGRYGPTGRKGALSEGLTSRRAVYEKVSARRVAGWSAATRSPTVTGTSPRSASSFSNAAGARLMAAFRASGALSDIRSFRLATTEAFDAAAPNAEQTYTPLSGT